MKRETFVERARAYSPRKYITEIVAPLFQKMIRAEAGADTRRTVPAVVDGEIELVKRKVGQCVCVTCGKVDRWDSGIKGMHTGHFVGSRCNSIVLEESNVAPQCSHCNYYLNGNPTAFQLWMQHVRPNEIDRLRRLRNDTRQFTIEELVDLRIAYQSRLNAAKKSTKGTT